MGFPEHKLVVTKPCREAWSSMADADNGKHCKSCDKIVTDFSILNDDEIKTYFLRAAHKPVCGRFKSSQLDRIKIYIPTYVFSKPIPYWKKFLLVFLICFGKNFYPFEIIAGKSNLYAQTTVAKKDGKKIKSKFKKKKYTQIVIAETKFDFPLETMILGFTQMIPNPGTIPVPDILVTKITSTKTDSGDKKSALQIKTHNKEPHKSPDNKTPENTTEFVLPAGFKYRRRKKNSH